jgi:hypothetical protein
MTTFNPDLYLTTMWRSLKGYIDTALTDSLYEVILGFPSPTDLDRLVPLEKTIIHFEIEDMPERPLGFGDNYVDYYRDETAPPDGQTIEYWQAHEHMIDFDVGIWASAESGGVTARLEARQLLSQLFSGKKAYRDCMETTDGVHIQRFTGGRNLIDSHGDIPVWRMVDILLTVKVFSRVKITPPVPYVGDIAQVDQEPELEISGELID